MQNIKFIRFVLSSLFIISILAQPTFAQHARFEHLSMDDGLSNNTVLEIFQDSRGFLWFGTEDGLNRYDGYNITIFKNDPEDSTSISGKKVYTIYEDVSGGLWFGTNGGLCYFDRNKEIFKTFKNNPDNPNSLPNNTVLKICEDPSNDSSTIWLATLNGLSCFNIKTFEFKNFLFSSKNPMNQRFLNMIFSLISSKKGGLWIGTFKGLLYFDPQKETFTHHNKINDFIYSLYEKDHDLLWLGTSEAGLNTYNPQTKEIVSLSKKYNLKANLEDKVIVSILKDKMGHFWIGTSSGLFQVDPQINNFSLYDYDPSINNSLNENNIRSLYIDKGGILWIGTSSGLNKLNFRKNIFIHYYHSQFQKNNISSNNIISLHEDKNQNIWIGTDNGLDLLNTKDKSFKHYPMTGLNPKYANSGEVNSIIEENNLIWLGTEAGLYSLNPKTEILEEQFPGSAKLMTQNVFQVLKGKSGDFWLATLVGLFKFNPISKTFIHYTNNPEDSLSLSHNFVYRIYEDYKGQLWIGTRKGLNKFDPQKNTFEKFYHDKNNLNSICNDNIIYIYESKLQQQRVLWLGTGEGLCQVTFDDNGKEIFRSFTTTDGLPHNKILGISEDNDGFLWILTANGLSRFDPIAKIFQNFNKNHGLSTNQFGKAIIKNIKNNLYIGSKNGLIVFHPSRLKNNLFKPSIALTKFMKFNQPAKLDSAINEIRQINLSYEDNFISIGFAALDFSSPAENNFQYKMQGLHEEWINVGNKHEATFTNLNPGNYIFQVKSTNSNGYWANNIKSVKIYIKPPYWSTWWFKTFASIFIILSLIGFYRYRTNKILNYNSKLQKIITEREKAEIALSKSEKNYREIFNSSSDAIFLHDANTGEILEVNQTMLEMYGYSYDEVEKLSVEDVSRGTPPYSPSDAAQWIKKVNEEGQQIFEWMAKKKNGELFWVEVALSKTKIHGENRVLAVVRNINDRKQTEFELNKAQSYINNILNSMPSIVIGVDTDISVTHWNREAENITGISKDKATGQPLEKVLPHMKNEIKRIKKSISSKQLIKENSISNIMEGKSNFSDLTVYPLISNGAEGAVIRVDDVTERVRLEEMMIQSEKMLSVGGLAAGMAHEINNPLAGMLQNAQVILNRLTQKMKKNDEVAKECNTTFEAIQTFMEKRKIVEMLEAINITGKRASKIVENMLSFSRKSESRFSSHDIRKVLDDTIDLAASDYDLKKKYDFRKIKIIKEYDEDVPLVNCERSNIQQVFLNVLRNGAQAMIDKKEEQKDKEPCFTFRVKQENEIVRIEIEDNGPGMDEETRRRAFEPFFTTKDVSAGTGLGLSVSYFIITEQHKGKMSVESNEEIGTKVCIDLPYLTI